MWPLILGAGAALLLNELFEEKPKSNKRIFISFAIEDAKYRDHFVAQAKKENSPFSFVDMSVKKPWNEKIWKQKCRSKIKSCDGVIVLLSKNTYHSKGTRWEIKCATQENITVVGMHIQKKHQGAIPPELKGKKIIIWTWENLEKVIRKI